MIHATRTLARRDVVALVLAAVCWGLGTVVSKAALAEFPPITLLAVQLASSLGVLIVLMRRQGISLRGDGPALLGRLGLLNPGAAYALGLLGLVSITASVSVLLWALEPMMIMLLAAAVLRERITPALVALSMAAVGGIALVVYDPATIGGGIVGVLLAVAGGLFAYDLPLLGPRVEQGVFWLLALIAIGAKNDLPRAEAGERMRCPAGAGDSDPGIQAEL